MQHNTKFLRSAQSLHFAGNFICEPVKMKTDDALMLAQAIFPFVSGFPGSDAFYEVMNLHILLRDYNSGGYSYNKLPHQLLGLLLMHA